MVVFELIGLWIGCVACLILPGLHDEYERWVQARKSERRAPLLLPRATALSESHRHH